MSPLADDRRLLLAGAQLAPEISPARLGVSDRARLVISPAVLTSLVPTVVGTSDADGSPLSDSRDGSVFTDGGNANRRWYLPTFSLRPAPDDAFAYAAVRDGSDQNGHPFNRATLTVGLSKGVPEQVAAQQQAQPSDGTGLTFSEIPLTSISGTLTLSVKDAGGNEVTHAILGQVVVSDSDPTRATFTVSGLVGPDVIVAFAELTSTGQASISLQYSYQVARWVTVVGDDPDEPWPHRPGIWEILERAPQLRDRVRDINLLRPPAAQALIAPTALTAMTATATPLMRRGDDGGDLPTLPRIDPGDTIDVRPPIVVLPAPRPTPLPVPQPRHPVPTRTAIHESATETVTLSLGATYAGPSYRPRFTLTADGSTRGIVSSNDLEQFRTVQSEYVELTVLGNVGSRYPSLRAVYLGQVSGTVVAVPATYGVLRTPNGLLATCHAVVDASATSASGCRFQFTFGLGPVVDPGDLAQLAADLAAEPTLTGRDLHLTLPTDLDRTTASAMQTSSVVNQIFVVGLVPNTFALAWDVVDGDLPAVAVANLLLTQFADPHTSTLIGRLAVRLDDAYQPPVQADVILDLATTAGADDVAIVMTPGGDAQLSNQSPLNLAVNSQTVHSATGFSVTRPHLSLPAAGTCVVDLPDGSDQLFVSCGLDLPSDSAIRAEDYVEIVVENVAKIHHPIGLNAVGQFGTDIAMASISMALDRDAEVAFPTIALSPDHPIDSTAVEVPVQFALEGLVTTVALTVTPTNGGATYQRTLTHDFLVHPVLTLSHADLSPGP